jgi:hypothetical protein
MKKLIFTLTLLSLPVFLFAQGVGIGIKAGANFGNFSVETDLASNDINTSSMTSYHVGAYANFNFSEKWGITPEVLWSAQGAKLDLGGDFNTDYVTVPILLRWKPIKPLFIEAGPQFNILTKAEADGQDVKDDMNGTSYCMAFGAGVNLPLKFNFGARYVLGLTDLAESDQVEIKDRTFQLYIGWTIFGAE